MKKSVQIGQVLLDKGYINEKQLERAIEMQKSTKGKRLGDILVELAYVSEKTIAECLAEQLNIPYVELTDYLINPKAVALIDRSYAQRNSVLPIDFKNNTLVVATSDPLAFYVLDELQSITGYEISAACVRASALPQMIERCYSEAVVKSATDRLNEEFDTGAGDDALEMMDDRLEGTPLIRLINTLITQAAVSGASDIHIEPTRNNLVVRFRINGDLVSHTTMTMAAHNAIVTRIKLLSEMDIAEKRVPQDGKFHFEAPSFELDIRTSSLPTVYGEKVVLRLLGNSAHPELMDLNRLGMDPATLATFQRMVKAPNGIVLVTGPTGSGKTTTLYAALNLLARRPVNIITIEDPVEQRIDNVNQVQINTKAELTFASALRSILRQDPDIIMVGEMRDSETASLGMRAAITGHLVLSTLHTNDTISSVVRMVDMGSAPYMVAAALTGVVAQRLVKVLCPHCKQRRPLTDRDRLVLGEEASRAIDGVYEPVGCQHCNNTGYSGRVPVYEIVQIDDVLRGMIVGGSSVAEMKAHERSKGTRFLRDSVTDVVLRGDTGIAEMERIVYALE